MPMNPPDLNSMYKSGMGNLASLYGGRQQAMAMDQEREALRKSQIENEQSLAMNPLKQQFQQGMIEQQQAQLPGMVGQSQTQAAQGQYDTATNAAKIADKLSDYTSAFDKKKVDQLERDGERMSMMAAMMENYPAMLHPKLAQEFNTQYGGDESSPLLKNLLSLPPQQIAPALKSMGKGMALASKQAIINQESARQAQEAAAARNAEDNATRERIAKEATERSTEVARIQAESREKVAAARGAAVKHMSMDQKIAFLSGIPEGERTEAETAQLTALSKQRLAERAAGANAVTPTVMGQATPTQNAMSTAEGIFPPAPTRPQPANNIGAMVVNAGEEYQPEKYHYRINPQTGRVEKKAK